MQALFSLAPSGPIVGRLQIVADALTAMNVEWLREQVARGNTPPCCSHCAGPPGTGPHGVKYVPHHGAKRGEMRAYLDGPSMMHVGAGTCIDIAAYDAACRIVLGGDPTARAIVEGEGPDFHCVVMDKQGRHDVVTGWDAYGEHNVGGCGCEK